MNYDTPSQLLNSVIEAIADKMQEQIEAIVQLRPNEPSVLAAYLHFTNGRSLAQCFQEHGEAIAATTAPRVSWMVPELRLSSVGLAIEHMNEHIGQYAMASATCLINPENKCRGQLLVGHGEPVEFYRTAAKLVRLPEDFAHLQLFYEAIIQPYFFSLEVEKYSPLLANS